jgi:hypothetical protein
MPNYKATLFGGFILSIVISSCLGQKISDELVAETKKTEEALEQARKKNRAKAAELKARMEVEMAELKARKEPKQAELEQFYTEQIRIIDATLAESKAMEAEMAEFDQARKEAKPDELEQISKKQIRVIDTKIAELKARKETKPAELSWSYQVLKDDLTSKPAYAAWVMSINEVNFDFPHQGAQRGQLSLRMHPQYGKGVSLSVRRGQMLVRSYEDTTVKVVFDSGSPATYEVTGPSDHSSNYLFFRDYNGFVERMTKARKVKISVPFYQQGDVVFEFNVSDFDSKKYLRKN